VAGKRGKRERRLRGSDSPTHLGLWQSEEAARRWPAEAGGGGSGGGPARLGRGRAVVEVVVEVESAVEGLFIGRARRGKGGRGGRPAGEHPGY